MKQIDIRNSISLKILSFCIVSLTIVIIILNILYMYIKIEEPDLFNGKEYTNTQWFADKYLNNFISKIRTQKNYELMLQEYDALNYADYQIVEGQNGETIYRDFVDNSNGFKYLFIDNENNIAYTNISLTSIPYTIQNLKNQLDLYKIFLNYNEEDKNFNTTINSINIQSLERLYEKNDYWNRNLEIYTGLDMQFLSKGNTFYIDRLAYDVIQQVENFPFGIITPIMCILSFISIIYLCVSIGHKKDYEGIYLNWFDKIPLELVMAILLLFNLFAMAIYNDLYSSTIIEVIFIATYIIILYFSIAIALATITKRLKAHTLLKNTLVYKMTFGIIRLIKNIFENFNLSFILAILYGGFLLIPVLLIGMFREFGVFLSIVFWTYIFIVLLNRTKAFIKIKLALKDLYNGITNNKIDHENYKGSIKEMAIYVNDIAGGFSNAVEESLKSERMKTELITNVSHDIKTPLTSIINYVDLIKKEEIDNEKVKEYIEILDNKSQRLKKLTDDLVEAAKASSGNVKLNMEKINIIELLKQTTAEFEDKFQNIGLEVIYTMPEEANIMADSRYMFRVVENIFSNISKYALENSRVYIDVIANNNKVYIGIKNISKQRLNISTEELMQRFVRGDKSRNTEGSGLGLSISKSLTELQNGTFNIQIDGDLFKVELEFTSI